MNTPTMIGRHIARMLREPMRLKLYQGPPSEYGMTEISGGGYRDIAITFRDWKIVTALGTPFAETGQYEFRFDGTRAIDVAGAYLVDDATGDLLWVQEFPEVFRISRTGDTIPVVARFALSALGDTTGIG